jgi:hypothetical protein
VTRSLPTGRLADAASENLERWFSAEERAELRVTQDRSVNAGYLMGSADAYQAGDSRS